MNQTAATPRLEVTDLVAGYGRNAVLRGVSFQVPDGKVVAILGANGAGKTTTVKTIVGVLRAMSGSIRLGGQPINNLRSYAIARMGVATVPEGRRVFTDLSVDENLRTGAYVVRDRAELASTRDEVLALFPALAARLRQRAGTLSGGEQQMLAIGRALMSRPQLLITDELSMGLAPRLVYEVYDKLAEIISRGLTVVVIEQNAEIALEIAHHGYVLANGVVVAAGTAAELADTEALREAYLGSGPSATTEKPLRQGEVKP